MQVIRLDLEAEAANRSIVSPGDGSAATLEILADGRLSLLDSAARRIETVIVGEGQLSEAMNLRGGFGAAELYLQAALTAPTSLVSESFASPKSMIVLGS
jgi:hypothetical protein